MIELLVAIVIVALLAALAWPTYVDSVRKGRRADAVSRLIELQLAQERWRANNGAYTTDMGADGLKIAATVDGGHYRLAVVDATASGYVATATALSSSPQASDDKCSVLKLTQAGARISYTSVSGGGSENTSANNECWNR